MMTESSAKAYLVRLDWEQVIRASSKEEAEKKAFDMWKEEINAEYDQKFVATPVKWNPLADFIADQTFFISNKDNIITVGEMKDIEDTSSHDINHSNNYDCPECGEDSRITFLFNEYHHSSSSGSYDSWDELCICKNLHVFLRTNGT